MGTHPVAEVVLHQRGLFYVNGYELVIIFGRGEGNAPKRV